MTTAFETIRRTVRRPATTLTLAMLALAVFVLPACQQQQTTAAKSFVPIAQGDLLFQETDGHPLAEAIKAVTVGRLGAKFTHVGIFTIEKGQPCVIEAGGKGVKLTPLAYFMARSRDHAGSPKVVLARLNPDFQEFAPAAVARARALIGRPYDDQFLLENGKFYCSELVYETYLDAKGDHLFAVAPMTFCPPGSSLPHPAWREYFQRKGQPIPEGRLGCNPGGLSGSDKLDIIFAFGRPSGWSEETYRRFTERVPAQKPSPRPLPGPAFSGQ
jgi:hypothetical protein